MNKIILTIGGLLLAALLVSAATQPAQTALKPIAAIKLTADNCVVFRGVVDSKSVITASLRLTTLVAKRGPQTYPIYLVFDSPGGSIDAGNNFIAYVKSLPNVQTITLFAASMAAGIVESLPGHRYVTEDGIFMFHRARGSIEGQFEDGEMEQRLAFYKAIVRDMEQRNANRIGLSLADYKAKVKDEWWIYGPSNVQLNVADSVASISCSPDLIAARETIISQIFIFTIKSEYSGCPLFRDPVPSSKPEKEEEEE